MTDDRFERFLSEAGQDYHQPPETPKNVMWQRIETALDERRMGAQTPDRLTIHRERRPWIWWSAGLAAALVLGIAIGRFTPEGDAGGAMPGPERAAVPVATRAYQVATTEHLAQVETFLTVFQHEARAGRASEETTQPARDLLLTTQLLLDSPAAESIQFRTLLEDIEVVLAQVAQYGSGQPVDELGFIDRGMEQRSVLLKLQAVSSAGLAGAQGAL
jgi:hypothetical protein